MEELKPCPFCAAVSGDADETEVWLCDNTDYESEYSFPMFMVMCNNCLASSGNFATEEEAIKEWNRRASLWKKVDERPEDMQTVLVMDKANLSEIVSATYEEEGGMFWSDFLGRYFVATHWMPIPELPEESII